MVSLFRDPFDSGVFRNRLMRGFQALDIQSNRISSVLKSLPLATAKRITARKRGNDYIKNRRIIFILGEHNCIRFH